MYCSQTYYKDRKPSPANNIVIYKKSHNQGMVQPRPLFKTIFTSFLNWRRSALSEIAKVMAAKQKGGGGRGGGIHLDGEWQEKRNLFKKN
jgi:hypothetical protein